MQLPIQDFRRHATDLQAGKGTISMGNHTGGAAPESGIGKSVIEREGD